MMLLFYGRVSVAYLSSTTFGVSFGCETILGHPAAVLWGPVDSFVTGTVAQGPGVRGD
jgi:hypothetical protein